MEKGLADEGDAARGGEVLSGHADEVEPAREGGGLQAERRRRAGREGAVEADGYPCENVDLLSRLTRSDLFSPRNNDIWGWTDPTTGNEYALVGKENGVSFVDVSTPTAPVILGTLPSQTFTTLKRSLRVRRLRRSTFSHG